MLPYAIKLAMAFSAGLCLVCLQALAQTEDSGFIIGTTTHFAQNKGILNENLFLLKQAGITSTRDEMSWCYETEKGKFQVAPSYANYISAAAGMGLSPLTILDYSNKLYDNGDYPRSKEAVEGFVRYAETVASALKGKCKFYQVWNEWDGGCGMPPQYRGKGDPESYIKLLSAVYPKIKAADPSMVLVSGSVCSDKYLKSLLELGLLKHCDVVSLHTYNYNKTESTPEDWHKRMLGVDQLLRSCNGGKEVPLFITEMGWPTELSGSGLSQSDSADCLARLYILAKTFPCIKGVWWYDFQDDGWNSEEEQDNFGLVRANLTPKKSFYVLKDLAPFLTNSKFVERMDAGDPKIWALKFKANDGQDIIALWSAYKDDDWEISLSSPAQIQSKFRMCVPGEGSSERSFGARDWADRKYAFDGRLFQVAVRGRPCILKGDLKDVRVANVARRIFPEGMRAKGGAIMVPGSIAAVFSVDSSKGVRSIDFGDECFYSCAVNNDPRKGRKDLDASFQLCYDDANLRLTVKVSDDVFCQDFEGAETWKGDGLQFAIQPLGKECADAGAHFDFDVALSKAGPAVFRQFPSAQRGAVQPSEIGVNLSKGPGCMTYELAIPAKAIGVASFKPGMVLGLSILVNDNDGRGRKGFLHWGGGIAGSKDPVKYNWINLER